MLHTNGTSDIGDGRRELMDALYRLDALLDRACRVASTAFASGQDRFRGLYINEREVERLLQREPASPAFSPPGAVTLASPDGPELGPAFARLKRLFGLSDFELDVLVIALGPEIDLRYERLYAYLQDDVTKKRPSADLALNLLTASLEERTRAMNCFLGTAPLFDVGILSSARSPAESRKTLLASELAPDPSVVRYLLGGQPIDTRFEPFCTWIEPDEPAGGLPVDWHSELVRRAFESGVGFHLHLYGAAPEVRRDHAKHLACQAGVPLLLLHTPSITGADVMQSVQIASLVCRLWGAILLIEGADAAGRERNEQNLIFLTPVPGCRGNVSITSSATPWRNVFERRSDVLQIPVEWPDYARRREAWESGLERAGLMLADPALDALAGRFRISKSGIDAAVEAVSLEMGRRLDPNAAPPEMADFSRVVRMQNGQKLSALACSITPRYTWEDIVLPAETLRQLREICYRVEHRQQVFERWGFGKRLSLGKGVNSLFAGPSGTGKTMAAEVIAKELELDLYRIDLSGVVSKYIGETEKNLDRVFTAAQNANAILFFDEADALFGKRSEVKDAHDRYANIEVSYLLQKMEEYDGLAILATNLRQNLDEAFLRRLAFVVHFPFPDESYRLEIWKSIWPAETPLAADLDLSFFAHRFKLSGGNIKNAALAAAFFAAEDGGIITMEHLMKAMQREYQKMGRTLTEGEMNGYHPASARNGLV